jgi:hypothetical protein
MFRGIFKSPPNGLVKNPIQSGHRPGDLFIFGHKQVLESAIVAGNKFLAAMMPESVK